MPHVVFVQIQLRLDIIPSWAGETGLAAVSKQGMCLLRYGRGRQYILNSEVMLQAPMRRPAG